MQKFYYRPFVTCDDPKGVVDCGTIRKSKSCVPKMEDKTEKRRVEKHSKTSSMAYKVEEEEKVSKGAIEDYHVLSSCQLLDISGGAQKLNRMIDEWSEGMSYSGGQPKDIAKDLLKGALDLQESLVMLGKLQEASNYMSQLKKKDKEKAEKRRIDAVGRKAASSLQYGDRNYRMGLQEPRLLADGSSMNSTKELKKVIRDGLVRQNLLPSTSSQDTSYSGRRQESISDIPSTSSNQPSLAHFTNRYIADSSFLQNVPQKKEKGPNLIARLMGLEEIPTKPTQQSDPKKQVPGEQMLSPRRPSFEIESPKPRRHHHTLQSEDSEERTLKEVLETMQFKGLLKGSSVKLLNSRSYQSDDHFYPYRGPIDEVAPIVLIKPMRATRRESEEAPKPSVPEEETWNRKMMQRKMNVQEGAIATLTGYRDSNLSASRMQHKMDTQKAQVKRLSLKKGTKDHRDEVADLEEKEVRTVDEREQAKNVTLHKKLEAESMLMKRLTREERPKECNEVVIRSEEKEADTKLKSSSKLKTSGLVAQHQQQKRGITDKRVDKVQKMAANGKKPVEREIAKPKNASRSRDHSKVMSTKQKKNERTITITQNQVPREQSATKQPISEHTTQSRTHNSKYRKRMEKTVCGTTAAKVTTDNIGRKENDKGIDHSYDDGSVSEGITSSPAGQLSPGENANASEVQAEGHENKSQSSLSDAIIPTPEYEDQNQNYPSDAIMPSPESENQSQNSLCNVLVPISEHQKNVKSSEEASNAISYTGRDSTNSKAENHLKVLLLSNQSFVTHVDELFHLELGGHDTISPASGIEDSKASEFKLILDYANEFIERRSLPDSEAGHPLVPAYSGYLRISISLDQLVEEICIGIETLRSYFQVAADSLSADTLYATLERDIWCKGVVSGTWELAWRSGFSLHHVDQAVIDIENLLLSDLMNEVFL